MMPPEEIKRLRELCEAIPDCISADTNHYEIHSMLPREHFWLDLPSVFSDPDRNICASEDGKRLGAVLDFVCGVRPSLPALLDEVERLEREVAELRRQLSNRIEAKHARVWTCADDRGPIIADDGRAAMIFVQMGGRWVNHKLHSWTEQGYKGSGYSQMPDAMAAEFLKTYPLPTEAVCE
jgi:hypothetical protein